MSIQEAKLCIEKMGDQERTGDQVKIVEKIMPQLMRGLNGGVGSPEGLERTEGNLNKNSCADIKSIISTCNIMSLIVGWS